MTRREGAREQARSDGPRPDWTDRVSWATLVGGGTGPVATV
jgi:hypothetical protein